MSNFISPGWLWALIVPLAAAIAYIVMQLIGRRTYALRFANAGLLEKVAPKRPGWRRHLVSAAMVLAMTMLVIALARPQAKTEIVDERTTIMLLWPRRTSTHLESNLRSRRPSGSSNRYPLAPKSVW